MRSLSLWKCLGGSTLVVLALLVCLVWWGRPTAAVAPIPSEFENATETAFVGSERCSACHEQQFEPFLHTAHHQAFGVVTDDGVPPGGEFTDPRTFRSYQIAWQDGQMRHAETLQRPGGGATLVVEHAMKYVVGSGRYSRSYLLEQDGCLFESPATWYSESQTWGLSPGYDKPNSNASFQRPIEYRCLLCHVGRVEMLDNSPQRLKFLTQAIDCERCHGPGERHVARWESATTGDALLPGEIDRTIVHPGKLDRRRGEDICMQCHLHSAATIERPGREAGQFRPGDRLEDYLLHYGRRSGGQQMEVTGHGEQMRLSRCYTASDSLTCTTCHNPHQETPVEQRVDWYRSRCLECHSERDCREPEDRRRQQSAADSCIDCHMPRGPTDIPHFAFTHHRIGIHSAEKPRFSAKPEQQELVLLHEPEGLTDGERQRNLGLAYLQFSDAVEGKSLGAAYQEQSRSLLAALPSRQRDSEVAAALGRLSLGQDARTTLKMASAVEADPQASPDALATAAFTRGATLYQLGQYAAAIPALEKAVAAKPMADIWFMLSDCYSRQQNLEQALEAARKAVRLSPLLPHYREYCHQLEQALGEETDPDAVRIILELQHYWSRVTGRPSIP